jgi:hypothetical protein
MKKIILILLAANCLAIGNAQVVADTSQLPEIISGLKKELSAQKLKPAQIEQEVRAFRESFLSSKSRVPLSEYKKFVKKSIIACDNGSFESNDLSGWTPICYKNGGGLPLGSNLQLAPSSPITGASYGVNVLDNSHDEGRHWHQLTPIGWGFEDWLSTSSPAYNIPVVLSSSGNYSLRLGNRSQNWGAEAVAKTFTVTNSNALFHFKYLFMTQKYHQSASGMEDVSSTFFLARAFDAATGTIIKYKVERGVTGNPFLTSTNHINTNYYDNGNPAANGPTLFRDWTCVTWDLTDFIGKDITVEFINSDCGGGAHKSVTYIDDICGTCTNTPIADGWISLNTTDTCGFKGPNNTLTVSGSYMPPIVQYQGNNHTGAISNLVINFYQGNSIVASFPIPSSAVVSGNPNNFIVNVPSSLFNGLSGCLDIVTEADFATINSIDGTPGTYHVQSGVPRGIKYGKDNDFCIECPCNCEPTLKPILITPTNDPNNPNWRNLDCGQTYTDVLDCFKQNFIYIDNPCGANCSPDSTITTVRYPNGTVQVGYFLLSSGFTANQVGTYTVSVKVKCGGKWCKECKLTFVQTKKCEPPCDNCKVNGQDKVQVAFNQAASTASALTHPAATTINAYFLLSGGGDTYTEVRASIVDFNITSDNPACLQCYNTPNNWGSIISGTLPGFTPVVTSYTGVSAANGNNSSREISFSAANPTGIPMPTNFNLTLKLPGVSPLSCCCLRIVLFVKITFRNNKCEECSKIVRIDLTECEPTTPGGTPVVTFNSNLTGHPQYRIHSPNADDIKILSQPQKGNN